MNNVGFPAVSNILKPQGAKQTHTYTPYEAHKSFASVLKNSIQELNNLQNESDKMTEKLVKGENVDLHQVMIASQKASVTLQATLEIRNKVIEAYQETMRMQV
ncbi:flagellar hook-basal body complex protein FliE [Bacillus sp. DTU_2020_1000418_1_SI_GHA_SEK_038]|uniref:flagellar hook-basal body complex protein FliE n=1 Tax=Bacillus sp. DTU_2020_1000418_1_SI_GHA_SEK_038 TaxID=3077585 RepID=UPI0028EC02BD|nr:flagellar hook-basal body complex protein FliE [Bacillus sp. DTU_2020_1000418_1_SI_GHA_SEK_038]WNS77170.1 flagellar hook-basal body complex protein FliE [Bacillus sp. DTU_2020_1000418_1_SI_GHA_SEK_038]